MCSQSTPFFFLSLIRERFDGLLGAIFLPFFLLPPSPTSGLFSPFYWLHHGLFSPHTCRGCTPLASIAASLVADRALSLPSCREVVSVSNFSPPLFFIWRFQTRVLTRNGPLLTVVYPANHDL